MILDYEPKTAAYILRVKRGEADPRVLVKEHGLDFSTTASARTGEAVLFTRDPYAASVFGQYASPAAHATLGSILSEVASSWAATSGAHIRCPADQELDPFQKANVEYALRRRNTLVGDQPGLGKTMTAICYANEISAKRVLVLCPANIRIQWARRIREWSTIPWPYVVYPILTSSRGVHPQAEWTIVSYDLARTEAIGTALARGTYDLIILDEAHYLKNVETARTRALFGDHTGYYREKVRDPSGNITGHKKLFEALSSRAGAIMALTGTPLPNRPREAYTLAKGLCFDSIDWMNEDAFKARFNPSAKMTGEKKLYGPDGKLIGTRTYTYNREEVGRAGELQNRLRANFMTRHLKKDVLTQLKLPVFDIVIVDDTKAVKQALNAEALLDIDPEHPLLKTGDDEEMGQIAVVRHMMGLAIAPLAADYCDMLLDGGEDKLCIFGWHIDVLDYLEARFAKYGTIRIDGSVLPAKRQRLIDDYVARPDLRICLGNIQSIGVGTDDLQRVCSHVVFPEFDWVPANNQQAVDRLDRRGQKRTVLADFLVAQGSLGEKMLSATLRKGIGIHKALDAGFELGV